LGSDGLSLEPDGLLGWQVATKTELDALHILEEATVNLLSDRLIKVNGVESHHVSWQHIIGSFCRLRSESKNHLIRRPFFRYLLSREISW
jgi:hypothetical protein